MFFQIYGENSFYQLLGWCFAFTGLILLNEFARKTEFGGVFCFMILPIILTVYFMIIYICAYLNQSWALTNGTYVHMNGWFHYAKLYAADIGSAGFVLLKYRWWIGKTNWFKAWPFVIVAINILIAVILCTDLHFIFRHCKRSTIGTVRICYCNAFRCSPLSECM